MKNVLHTIHVMGPGGAETVCLELARGLDPERWRSFVTIPARGWIHDPLVEAGIEPILIPSSRRVGYLRGVLDIIRRRRIDLIQAHLLGPAVNASVAGMIAGVPVVSTFHGYSDVSLDGPLRDGFRHRAIRLGTRRVVCVSEPLRRFYLERSGNRPERTTVIVNGIDTERFKPRQDASVKHALGFSAEHIVVGTIANVREPKDYPTFLRAAAVLAAESPRYRFVAVGDGGPLMKGLIELRDALGLRDRFVFTGFREDTDVLLGGFDVFVVSSKAEGFSLATVQAMAAGVPVVATRCGGPEEILDDGATGILVGIGAANEIAAAIGRVIGDEELRRRLTASARQTAVTRFSTAEMIRCYGRLYEQILDSGDRESAAAELASAR